MKPFRLSLNLLDAYLLRAVLQSLLLAWLALAGLEVLFLMLAELADLGRRGYGFGALMMYVLRVAPRRIYEVLPAAALIGSLLGLSALVRSGELTALRAAGCSLTRIARTTLLAAAPVVLAGLLLGEVLAPALEESAQRGRALAQGREALAGTGGGFWTRRGDIYLRVARVEGAGVVAGVEAWEFRGSDLQRVVRAPRGVFGPRGWTLEQATLTAFRPEGWRSGTVASLPAPFLPDPGAVVVSRASPERLSLSALVQQARLLERNGRDSQRYWLALWAKLTAPATTLVMVLLGLPLVLRGARSAPLGQRLLLGVVVGLVYYVLNQVFAYGGLAYGLPPWVVATAPTLAALFAAVDGLRRAARV